MQGSVGIAANITALRGRRRIGRITEGLLVNVATEIDVVEPVAKFTVALHGKPGVRTIFNVGLEEWQPGEDVQYDLVWTQWCVGHLTDEQLVQYLERCKAVLEPESGVIVIKENISTNGVDIFDDVDSAVTRLVEAYTGQCDIPLPNRDGLPCSLTDARLIKRQGRSQVSDRL